MSIDEKKTKKDLLTVLDFVRSIKALRELRVEKLNVEPVDPTEIVMINTNIKALLDHTEELPDCNELMKELTK